MRARSKLYGVSQGCAQSQPWGLGEGGERGSHLGAPKSMGPYHVRTHRVSEKHSSIYDARQYRKTRVLRGERQGIISCHTRPSVRAGTPNCMHLCIARVTGFRKEHASVLRRCRSSSRPHAHALVAADVSLCPASLIEIQTIES